jgi:hypothetical protein
MEAISVPVKYDYLYINPFFIVIGRLSTKEYYDELSGYHLGRGTNLHGAYSIASIIEKENPFTVTCGIKISESIEIDPVGA